MKRQLNIKEAMLLVRRHAFEKKVLRKLEEEKRQHFKFDEEIEAAINKQKEIVRLLHKKILTLQAYYEELKNGPS